MVVVVRWVVGPLGLFVRVVAQIADCAILVGARANVNVAKALAVAKDLIVANKQIHCFWFDFI